MLNILLLLLNFICLFQTYRDKSKNICTKNFGSSPGTASDSAGQVVRCSAVVACCGCKVNNDLLPTNGSTISSQMVLIIMIKGKSKNQINEIGEKEIELFIIENDDNC